MVYDCITIYNELDLLEIRLNILDPYVDYFIISESSETFSGKTKPLYLKENWDRFSKWHNKIILLECPLSNPEWGFDSFERAHYQKEYLKEGLKNTKDDDIVFFGDLDEIINPDIIICIKNGTILL